MKAPWFPFYTGDFLASPDVQLMSAAEVGAYTLLLASSWQSDAPGYLPDDESRLRRICRLSPVEWAESGPLLLSKWPRAENGLRHNPRLVREAGLQNVRRERLAANGSRGGRPAKNLQVSKNNLQVSPNAGDEGQAPPKNQKDSKPEPTQNLQVSENNLQVMETEPTGLLSQPQPQSSTEDVAAHERTSGGQVAAPALPAPAPGAKAEGGRGAAPEMPADEAPVFTIAGLRAFATQMGYAQIEVAHYLQRIQRKADEQLPRSAKGWENYVLAWLDRESAAGNLVTAGAPAPLRAAPGGRPMNLGPAPVPLTTGYDLQARAEAQKHAVYL